MNLALLIVGIFESRSVYLSVVASKLPIRANKWSLARRLERFVDNEAVDVDAWYRPWLDWLIQSASSGGCLHLVVDSTKVSARHRLIMIAVAYQRRTLPLMWTWVPYARGHSTTKTQIALFERLRQRIAADIAVSVVGDGELNHPLLIEMFTFWGQDYALRQSKNTLIMQAHDANWKRVDSFSVRPGQTLSLEWVLLTEASPYPTNLVIHWKSGEKDPWYLATSCLSGFPAIRLYKRRMWIEEMFGDMKGNGFDVELTRRRTPERLSRLTMAVCILYVWLMTLGEYVLKNGLQGEVDRTDRRDLSLFRLGWDWLERRFALNDPIPLRLRPDFSLVSGC